MRVRTFWLIALAGAATAAGVATLSFTQGQAPVAPTLDPPPARLPAGVAEQAAPLTPDAPPAATPAVRPAVATAPAETPPAPAVEAAPGLDKLPPLTRQLTLAARRGAGWLARVNQPTGRFHPGWSPALNRPLEGDHFLVQATATYALARAARLSGDEGHTARASQALLTLLAETQPAEDDPQALHTVHPSPVVDRLAAAGLIALAIDELPGASDDLRAKAEQLCRYIVKQQQADGTLRAADAPADLPPEAGASRSGPALLALAVSQRTRPADWKEAALRKAFAASQTHWQSRPSLEAASWLAPAYAEQAIRAKDPATAPLVYAIADWACELQILQPPARRPEWYGGFQGTVEGRPAMTAPRAESARLAGALVAAARLARAAGDAERAERYRAAAARGLQFVSTLQYTEVGTQHFVAAYRPHIAGGVHGSHQDGDLRLTDTAYAVVALADYLSP
jgi:hypothetical protein